MKIRGEPADASAEPYDPKMSDRKRMISAEIKKAMKGKIDMDQDQLKDLIKTRRTDFVEP